MHYVMHYVTSLGGVGGSSTPPRRSANDPEIGALCHTFRDIDVLKYQCFYRGGPLGCYLEKSTKHLNIFEKRNLAPIFFVYYYLLLISNRTQADCTLAPWVGSGEACIHV